MKFRKLKISEWQQFQNIEIDFHDRLTILTGANGSGKTTILANILAKHYGWVTHSLSTPKKDKAGIINYCIRFFNGVDKSAETIIGELLYENNIKATLEVPKNNTLQYNIQIKGQHTVNCFFIPSHKSLFIYRAIGQIPFSKKDKQAAFQEVSSTIRNKYNGSHSEPISLYMKNTLIGWAIQGYGVCNGDKEIMPSDKEQIDYFEGFKDILKILLPEKLGFEDFEIREREIIFYM